MIKFKLLILGTIETLLFPFLRVTLKIQLLFIKLSAANLVPLSPFLVQAPQMAHLKQFCKADISGKDEVPQTLKVYSPGSTC